MKQATRGTIDLTQGRIAPLIITFALPIFVGEVFQNLYNSVDSIVVGRFVSMTALAAVTSSNDISQLLIGFFTGLSAGAGVLFARFFGAKDWKNLHDSIHTALLFSVIFGTVISILGAVLTPWILQLVSCPEDVLPEASRYLRIYFIGALFTAMYNVGSGVLRAAGNSKDPFRFLVIASVTNIVLDVVFVVGLHWGVVGVAAATIISQLLSVALVLSVMLRTTDVYRLHLQELRINRALLLEILNLGVPAGMQTSLVFIGNLFTQRFINLMGSAAMAGIGAAKKVDKFVGIIANSLGLACSTFVGQNMGAKQQERAFQGIRVCTLVCFVAVTAVGPMLYLFAGSVVGLFTDDLEAIRYGAGMVRVLMPLYYIQVLHNIFSSSVRGFGYSRPVMVLVLIGMVGIRQLFLHISMYLYPSVINIYLAWPVGWFFSSLLVFIYYMVKIRLPYNRQKNCI